MDDHVGPQIDVLDNEHTTDLVLMTIGVNDIGFMGIVNDCPIFVDVDECISAVKNANAALDTFGTALTSTLIKIREKLKPSARVVLVSYPHSVMQGPYVIKELDLIGRLTGGNPGGR